MNMATKFEQDAIEKPKMMKINADKSLFAGTADDSYSAAENISVCQHCYKPDVSSSLSIRQIAEQLWSLLDDIDTLSDICKPTFNNPMAAMAFYRNAMKYARKRFELLKSDGYKIYTNEEFEALPKPESSFAFLDKDEYKEEKINAENSDGL